MPKAKPPCKLAFIDTETTGLDPERHEIFEIGLVLRSPDHEVPKAPQRQYAGREEAPESVARHERWRQDIYEPWAWEKESQWWVPPVHLETADATALRLNGYYQRVPRRAGRSTHSYSNYKGVVKTRESAAEDLAIKLDGAHLVGFNPSFDARFLEVLLRRYGFAPSWHYHLIDVEAMMLGHLHRQPPFKSDDLVKALGIEVPKDRHTALADAQLAKLCYDEVVKFRPAQPPVASE